MKLLILDNYDSFVYNIAQLLGKLGVKPLVFRNDRISLENIKKMDPDAIIISPGPGHPADEKYFGICNLVIKNLGPIKPILGICLGHQGVVNVFGGKVINAKNVRHGKTSLIQHYENDLIFDEVPREFKATRYHSLVADQKSFPDCLEITARAKDDGEIMGLKHKKFPIEGVQFHPESILTHDGSRILKNFIRLVKK